MRQVTGYDRREGQFVTRSFKGKYEIVERVDEHTQKALGVLGDGGLRIDVKI